MDKVNVLIHTHTDLSREDREGLEKELRASNGVTKAYFNEEHPHMLMVFYDPVSIDSAKILEQVTHHGIEAELVGL